MGGLQKARRVGSMTHLNPLAMANSNERTTSGVSSTSNGLKGRRKDQLEKFIESPNSVISGSLSQLRHTILVEGLPDVCPYRIYIWSILLRSGPIESEWYSGMVVKNAMPLVKVKITNDAFRTFQLDKEFGRKVKESSLIRVLNVFAWSIDDESDVIVSHYVQGMNILAGTVLYVSRSEPEAFGIFQTLLKYHIPRYVTPNLRGVMDGVKLVDVILQLIDKRLFNHLQSTMLSAKIYAFPLVLTLGASNPPLDQIVKLWDFLFSYGCHLNIVFIVAQVILNRDQLLKSKTPMTLLRQFPEVNANKIIKLSLSIIKNIDDRLYDLLVRHTFDDDVSELIDNYKTI